MENLINASAVELNEILTSPKVLKALKKEILEETTK